MKRRGQTLHRWPIAVGLLLLVACGDDAVMSDGSSTTGSDPTGITSSNTDGAGSTGTDGPSSTGTDGPNSTGTDGPNSTDTDGPPAEPGHSNSAFVGAGDHTVASPQNRLIFTFGQSTTNQNTMSSPNYRLRGGLVPATQ